jgi:Helix-turn-helix domain
MTSLQPATVGGKSTPTTSFPSRIGFEFHAIPKALLRKGDLSFGAVALFSVILNLSRQGRQLCRATNETLAGEIGRNRSDVIRYLAELEKAGLIARRYGDSQRVREAIEVTWTPDEVTESPVTLPTESSTTSDAKIGRPVTQRSDTLKNGKEERKESGSLRLARPEEYRKPLEAARIASGPSGNFGPISQNWNQPAKWEPPQTPRGAALERTIAEAREPGWKGKLQRDELRRLVKAGELSPGEVPAEIREATGLEAVPERPGGPQSHPDAPGRANQRPHAGNAPNAGNAPRGG